MTPMDAAITPCPASEADAVREVVNLAAEAYRGVIPDDCWHEPYMSSAELAGELEDGVAFVGYREGGALAGVMGLQDVRDVTLIRHAYVRPERQGRGIGSALLGHLLSRTERPVLVGTWTAAGWALRFYEGHGFRRAPPRETLRLLRRYWSVPEPQMRASTVLLGPRCVEAPERDHG